MSVLSFVGWPTAFACVAVAVADVFIRRARIAMRATRSAGPSQVVKAVTRRPRWRAVALIAEVAATGAASIFFAWFDGTYRFAADAAWWFAGGMWVIAAAAFVAAFVERRPPVPTDGSVRISQWRLLAAAIPAGVCVVVGSFVASTVAAETIIPAMTPGLANVAMFVSHPVALLLYGAVAGRVLARLRGDERRVALLAAIGMATTIAIVVVLSHAVYFVAGDSWPELGNAWKVWLGLGVLIAAALSCVVTPLAQAIARHPYGGDGAAWSYCGWWLRTAFVVVLVTIVLRVTAPLGVLIWSGVGAILVTGWLVRLLPAPHCSGSAV